MSKINRFYFFIIILILTFWVAYGLTSRYFPIEPDAANSSLVWRALLAEGISVFKDWAPTPDNWYFTVYPINFLFFLLTGNDGIFPLTLSTSVFVAMTAIVLAAILYSITRTWHALLAILALVCLPAFVYTFGFVAHPFSHYSTNFFGAVCLALSLYNLKKNSVLLAVAYSIISLLAAVSDPWFSATYFLPLLLVNIYFSWKKVISVKTTGIVFVAFILSMTHVLPRMLGLPIQRFKLVPVDQWLINAQWTVQVLGKSLNLFFVDNFLACTSSLIIWTMMVVWALYKCLKHNNKTVFIALFSFLTIAAIISSFIISYDLPSILSARFFVNVICFSVIISTLCYALTKNPFYLFLLFFYVASSCYSYHITDKPFQDQRQLTNQYMSFLEKNHLNFGYGDFWHLSNNVNWLSGGRIHITPVLFNDDLTLDLKSSRSQTLRSWLSQKFIKSAPNRQFIAIPLTEKPISNPAENEQYKIIKKQFGNPDEVLTFQDMIILIYSKKIEPQ